MKLVLLDCQSVSVFAANQEKSPAQRQNYWEELDRERDQFFDKNCVVVGKSIYCALSGSQFIAGCDFARALQILRRRVTFDAAAAVCPFFVLVGNAGSRKRSYFKKKLFQVQRSDRDENRATLSRETQFDLLFVKMDSVSISRA